MTTTRIYVVIKGEERKLVEAASPAQAIRHCARETFQARVATTREVANLLQAGSHIEKVNALSDVPNEPNQTKGEN